MVEGKKSGKSGKGGKSMPEGKIHRSTKKEHGIVGLSKPTLRRLARRAGVKRLSRKSHDDVHKMVEEFISVVVGDAVVYSTHSKRKTITLSDVKYSLKNFGVHVVGYLAPK